MIKRIAGCLAAALFLLLRLPAFSQQKVQVELYSGNQQQDLHWSIAGNSSGQHPNVYSELKWKDISGISAGGALTGDVWRRWLVFAEGARLWTRKGSVTDTDYGEDNRTDPVYKERFGAQDGYSYSAGAGIGYRVLNGPKIKLTPFIGYGWSGQHLSITDRGGTYSTLNSSYSTHWRGVLVRARVDYCPDKRWTFSGTVTYRQVAYHAEADWNLISSFEHPVSFRHHADGYGVEAEGRVAYRIGERFGFFAAGSYFNWQTGNGVDELYETSGATAQTQLNGVYLTGYNTRLGVDIYF